MVGRLTDTGAALIKSFEQFRAAPYLDAAGIWTFGWGAIRDSAGHPVTPQTPPVTLEEAETLFRRDVAVAERAVGRLISAPLTAHQFDALTSFTYNLGSGALQRSRLRACVNRGEHDAVPGEFLRWVWAGGRRLQGLVRRRAAEARLYQLG